MSAYDFYQRKMKVNGNSSGKNCSTLGEKLKSDSDKIMELTWNNDLAAKTCYIYDHFHDDFFTDEHGITRSLAEGMTYENTNKTKIDAKFIIKSYQSMDKDQVEYYLMFRPTYTPWRTVTDTLPHYTIYLAIYEYNKTKDKAKAKEELLKCDLSELDSFDKDIKKVINEILGDNKKTVNTTPNKEQTSKTDNKLVQKK